MSARTLMLQGTGSDVGKSVLVTGLCRVAKRRGINVAPFKPQNMSNNAAVCDGGEIGRAQALQARAAGLRPNTDMNPILLKPESDTGAQVIVQGKALGRAEAKSYLASARSLLPAVLQSYKRLCTSFEMVIVEGAGSPAEINLRDRDIANMGFAREVDAPVILVGDIDRGGVIASIVGTQSVLDGTDAAMIKGFLVNKFRGDPTLFADGMRMIEQRTQWPSLGLVPWLPAAAQLPAEDAVTLQTQSPRSKQSLRVCAPLLSRIANFDDADPLAAEPNVEFNWIPPGEPIPRDCDVIILFGTKSTIAELAFLRTQGWDHDIVAHARQGGRILGLCGGYQMLGRTVVDEHAQDGVQGKTNGLGLLDIDTIMTTEKTTVEISGEDSLSDAPITGYEIHVGCTNGPDTKRPFAFTNAGNDGARSEDGKIEGSYIHGLFNGDRFRQNWLERAGHQADKSYSYDTSVDVAIDKLADHLEAHVDLDALFDLARPASCDQF